MKFRFTIVIMFSMAFLLSCSDSGGGNDREWELSWSDEFEGIEGELPDSDKWSFEIGTDWGNGQLEFDTDRAENVSLNGDGNLRIVARKESYNGSAYTSARIVTKGKFEQAYGRFEARMKLPYGQGLWPAFWLLGTDFAEVGWPDCGEIDIMEYRGQEVTTVHGTVHGPGYFAGGGVTNSYTLPSGRFDTGFHDFAVEWFEDELRFFVDDELYHLIRPHDLPGNWVFDKEFYIILNLAVGGGYVGWPDASTEFPQTLLVDYVRVFEEK